MHRPPRSTLFPYTTLFRSLSASTTAFCTAGVERTVADSPIPWAPNGFIGVGVSVLNTVTRGTSVAAGDRMSTRQNSSHPSNSYAVFCLNKNIDGTGVYCGL